MPRSHRHYRVTAELAGFTTLTRTGLQLQVGQQAAVKLQMAPRRLQETVTVTAEAPLIDVTQSKLGGKHRSAADAGAAAQRPQLAGPDAAGAGKPIHHGRRDADPARAGGLSDQHGRPADHQQRGGQRLRTAAFQPRFDRRVRVHLQPVRRDAGPLDGRRGERRHQVGHQHAVGNASRGTSATTGSTRPIRSRSACFRIRTSS